MKLTVRLLIGVIGLLSLNALHGKTFEQGINKTVVPQVLAHRDRAEPINEMLKHRLDVLLPELMAESELDMWLVINREYGEDALFYTLVPEPTFAARRTTLLVFVRTDEGVERFSVSRYPIVGFYESRWQGGSDQEQWQRLAEIIGEYDPKKIGINVSEEWAVADGLSQGLYKTLMNHLPSELQKRVVSSEELVIRWFETRTEPEKEVYPQIVGIARGVIAEAFSTKVITPGVTTDQDVSWYIRERFEELGVKPWFQPYVTVQRKGDSNDPESPFFGKSDRVIMPGDIIHTDVGLCYLKLCTDTQEMGYVGRFGEYQVPKGLKDALAKGNHWQDILTSEFKTGRTGNQILQATQAVAKKQKLQSSTYTHPLGYVGHAVGPTIGMWDNQGPTPVKGDRKLYPNTAYAIEGNVKVALPEWDGQLVQIMLEQSALFDGEKVVYLAGRQTEWHFVR
ncbi:M24 family metallopeptidase [Kangiella koreensis]|uniref:Xaa-Pro aminopeptidase family enzyme n=1 Tax=Kangiella koreensis (strain DSM 16069 / JCM 12317 / KCTC 12182 / SW-125) TaxID=523791 RepID=C7R8B1_KANKD|nr:M24 family metallopeptidase [Kangiella koreensis]ACV27676.1 Xaa-Pro aminopeptidase family enzyme [Kangiella koreensis DSM 16069]